MHLHVHYFWNRDILNGKCDFGGYFELIFISFIVLDIQKCSVMLKTALFDSLPKDVVANSRKIVLDGPDFEISSILDFMMVISFATFASFM